LQYIYAFAYLYADSNAVSLWLCLQKASTVSAPPCVNSKKNGCVVNEDPAKKRPEPNINPQSLKSGEPCVQKKDGNKKIGDPE